jgi:D-lactate dehydrogenase (cytochrome)
LDDVQIAAVNACSKLTLPIAPTLFLEFGGTPQGVAEQVNIFRTIAGDNGAFRFEQASLPEERSRLWAARHSA